MSRWEKVYDKESGELIDKQEFDRRRAARAKPYTGGTAPTVKRGLWAYNKATGMMEEVSAPRKVVVPAPFVKTDEIPPTLSHATDEGKVFTSKAKLRAHYKEHHMIETGGQRRPDETPKVDHLKDIKEDTARALNALRWGEVPQTEMEKECNLRELRAMEQYKKRA